MSHLPRNNFCEMDSVGLKDQTVAQIDGRILLYVRNDLSSCLLTEYKLQDHTECLSIKINIRKKKWLLCCSYNRNKNNISKHLYCLSNGLDTSSQYCSQYDNIMLLGDLNVESSDSVLNAFRNVYNLFSLIIEPRCFKNPDNPSFPYKSSKKFS